MMSPHSVGKILPKDSGSVLRFVKFEAFAQRLRNMRERHDSGWTDFN
jgi:hypothetical protein